MNTAANIIEIFEKTAKKCISLQSGINGSTNSYDSEQTFRKSEYDNNIPLCRSSERS
jgi:hypothetical protein